MTEAKAPPIALALSGGGIRAMVFHLGVLKCLAEQRLLERVSNVSTVSGGSLILGLLLQEAGMKWPTSSQYLEDVLPALQQKLCTRGLMGGMLRQLYHPRNWRFLASRANLVAGALREEWGIAGCLADLPEIPEWSINGTTAETGKRFRFKRDDLGDYVLGYAAAQYFPLAEAIAVSAAFPGGVGPLVIDSSDYEWQKRGWLESRDSAKPVRLPYAKLHLYDGGVYDNLGLEPFFDAGKGQLKAVLAASTAIIVSDAGAPLSRGFSYFRMNPWRMKRVADIMSDQSRALRVRTFVSYLQRDLGRGSYLYIGEPVSNTSPCTSAGYAAEFPTTLKCLNRLEFEALVSHGYLVAAKNHSLFGLTGEVSLPFAGLGTPPRGGAVAEVAMTQQNERA
ncbi:MAG: patatin-like phospholipase family protein [bacterium]|nr:patatin-like phospholipase family protein [bacterium]